MPAYCSTAEKRLLGNVQAGNWHCKQAFRHSCQRHASYFIFYVLSHYTFQSVIMMNRQHFKATPLANILKRSLNVTPLDEDKHKVEVLSNILKDFHIDSKNCNQVSHDFSLSKFYFISPSSFFSFLCFEIMSRIDSRQISNFEIPSSGVQTAILRNWFSRADSWQFS